MITAEYLTNLRRQGIEIRVEGERLICKAAKGALLPEIQADLKAHKADIISFLTQGQIKSGTSKAELSIKPSARDTQIPLSFGQRRLWFLHQLEPDTSVYNMPYAFKLTGKLNRQALHQSLNEIISRHEVLRTTFKLEGDEPVQVIVPQLEIELPVINLRHKPVAERDAELERLLKSEASHSFNLAEGPLLRAGLVQLTETSEVFFINFNHIISDGWSCKIFWQELATLYAAFSNDQPSPLPELPIQYADFGIWQRDWLQGEVLDRQLTYWQEQLNHTPPLLQLPTDHARPSIQSYKGQKINFSLPLDLAGKLQRLSQTEGVSLFMLLLGAFKVLLYRYTAQTDIVIGAPIAGRNQAEVKDVIGFFINTLVLRTNLSGNPTFRDLLSRIRQITIEAFDHQDIPFEKLVEELRPERSLDHTPLFQVFFNMLTQVDLNLNLTGLTTEALPLMQEEVQSKFDLTMYVEEDGEHLDLAVVYNADLFERNRIDELLQQYQYLLQQIVKQPETPIDGFSLLPPSAKELLLDPTQPLSTEWMGAVHDRFSQQAQQLADHPAVIDPHITWSYQELEQHSNQLAHYLIAHGIQPGEVVAVYAHRSASLVWAWLGILKAGAAFVNLDPAYPAERLSDYLEVSQPRALIQLEAAGDLPIMVAQHTNLLKCQLILPQQKSSSILADYPTTPPNIDIGPDDTAYIAFTSGSTGQPKGVRGRHGPLSHFLPWQSETFGLTASDRFSMLSGLSHDPLQRDIFTAWWVGATICVPDPDLVGSPGYLAHWMQREQITFANLTPAMSQLLVETAAAGDYLPTLRYAFFIGEALTHHHVTQLRHIAPAVACFNLYGTTETQRALAYYAIPDETPAKAVYPLGQGLPGCQMLLLNESMQQAGIGEVGEIYVRSPHLASGYLGGATFTQAKFITNPFTGDETDRLYRTGDLGRYRPDGVVEFTGRADRQLKIRGFRVEPGEIEAALAQHPQIQQAVVMARDDLPGGYGLAAYLISQQDNNYLSIEDIRTFLEARFPPYMVPVAYARLQSLPLTPNGKVDYQQLPRPQSSDVKPAEPKVGPRNQVEQQLVQIWTTLLERENISIYDNFFELGGHSLLAIRLFTQIELEFGKKLPLTTLFQWPTIAELSKIIAQDQVANDQSILIPIQPGQPNRPPFFCVHGFGGGVVGYGELARLMGVDQPVYGLQARGIDSDETPDANIETMASRYIDAMRQVQPHGPYYVGGYCYGGVVAFEIARQLKAQGQNVALVAILEGYAPLRGNNRESVWRHPGWIINFIHNLPYWLADYLALDRHQLWQRSKRQIRSRWKLLSRILGQAIIWDAEDIVDDIAHISTQQRHLMQSEIEAMSHYNPEQYEGVVTLFRTRSQSLSRTPDPTLGWRKLATGGVEVKQIAGSHHNILEQPNVQTLAAELKQTLDQHTFSSSGIQPRF